MFFCEFCKVPSLSARTYSNVDDKPYVICCKKCKSQLYRYEKTNKYAHALMLRLDATVITIPNCTALTNNIDETDCNTTAQDSCSDEIFIFEN